MKTAIEVRERPAIFQGWGVQAILEGRKTQTRRVINPQPERYEIGGGCGLSWGKKCGGCSDWLAKWCPFGVPGDRLWVRETFMFAKGADVRESYIGTDMEPMLGPKPWYWYRATEPDVANDSLGKPMFKWRAAIHMPRHASRLTLEITEVRVQRLQDISEEDARVEGIFLDRMTRPQDPRFWFADMWDSINGKRFPWESNPWVWVIDFRKL